MATTTEIPVTLNKDEILRYSRHLIMPEVGMEGQQKLKAARVLCIGTGGLGSPLALYLAAAGVGTLGLVDFDVVDYTNLQRQIIHSTADVGRKKLESAADKLKAINPFLNLQTFDTRLSSANALEMFRDFDIIADGTDNFPTRYLVNDACVLTGKPNVYGSIFRFEGQASVFATEDGPCYRCLYPEPPPPGLVPSCAEGGVLGILPGLVGVMQATEVIKLILGIGDPLIGRLLLIDALGMKFRELKLRKNPDCPVCGTHPTVTKLIDYNEFCGIRGEEKPCEQWRSRNSSGRIEAASGRERRFVRARRARAARIPDLQHRRISDSAERSAEARERTRLQPRNRRPLQDGRTQRKSRRIPAAGGLQESAQSGGRNHGVVGSRGSESAEVLKGSCQFSVVSFRERIRAPFLFVHKLIKRGARLCSPFFLASNFLILLARTCLHLVARIPNFQSKLLAVETGCGQSAGAVLVLLHYGRIIRWRLVQGNYLRRDFRDHVLALHDADFDAGPASFPLQFVVAGFQLGAIHGNGILKRSSCLSWLQRRWRPAAQPTPSQNFSKLSRTS